MSKEIPAFLPRNPPDGEPYGFQDLRKRGLAWAQAASGQRWTDYNLHDPGVTLLESLCFALTQGVYQADLDLSDLLAEPHGQVDLARHALHPPLHSLPTRPVVRADYIRWLLDRVPELERIEVQCQPGGLWRLRLVCSSPEPEGLDPLGLDTARAFWAARNLGEDLEGRPERVKTHRAKLILKLSLNGPRDVVDVLVDTYLCLDRAITGEFLRQALPEYLAEGLASGRSLDTLLEGPPCTRGWLPTPSLVEGVGKRIFFSDLARTLKGGPRQKGVHGIEDVLFLGLELPGQDSSLGSLPRGGEDWALRLQWPETPEDLASIQVYRKGREVTLPRETILEHLRELAATPKATAPELPQGSECLGVEAELLRGEYLAPGPFMPALEHLPPLYRGAEALGGPQAKDQDRATFLGYMTLLEQWLAHGEAQGHHLRELFSVDGGGEASYWWEPLGDRHLPGLDQLLVEDPARVQHWAFGILDDARERQDRVLDFLLALHGVEFSQHRLRTFGAYFLPKDWAQHLLNGKRKMLENIIRYNRDRSGGFDYSRSSLDQPHNTAVLQEVLSLQLGFKHPHSRTLTRALLVLDLQLGTLEDESPWQLKAWPGGQGQSVPFPETGQAGLGLSELQTQLPPLRQSPLHPALWRCAAHADRYNLVMEDFGTRLILGPDERGDAWELAHYPDAEGAPERIPLETLARGLWTLASQTHLDSEGLHLVEHILLRPLGPAASELPEDFYPHRISLVFPGWTTRGADPAFRDLAQTCVSHLLPAHLAADFLWLDLRELQAFETLFQAWLEARIAHCAAPETPSIRATLDQAASALRQFLWQQGPGATP